MKKSKIILIFMILFLISGVCPMSVQANSAPPPGYFYFEVTGAESNAVYADVLMELSLESEGYVECNSTNAKRTGFDAEAPIAVYQEDGYMSMGYHYAYAVVETSTLAESSSNVVTLTDSERSIDRITPSIKIALLDENGNVLKVSKAVSVLSESKKQFPRTVHYDASADKITVEFSNYPQKYNLISLILIRMLVSVLIETLLAFLLFKIRPITWVVFINMVTQILLILFFLLGRMAYLPSLVIGEAGVYLIEFIFYLCVYKNYSKKKLLAYTITANTVTLCIGLIADAMGLPLLFLK